MNDQTADGNPLDLIIAEYVAAVDAGKVPSRHELLEKHPDHAVALLQFFADYDRLDNRAGEFQLGRVAARPTIRYFGDYELLEEIAEGGMGLVYKARQLSLNRLVALKMVLKGASAKPLDVARFRLEAEAAAGLDHPNIVPIYEVGEHENQHYLSMKFIDGPTLARLPRGDLRTEVAMMEKIARAVHNAHQQGILHRDIKPSNILLENADVHTAVHKSAIANLKSAIPYITDFGLAKRLDTNLSLSETGKAIGTAGYMSPEQALGLKGLTVTTDVFSLGAVLYERMTGHPAFPGSTILERIRSLHDATTPRPTMHMPDLPRDLETVCLKCLEREPNKRYANAELVADDLGRWLKGEPITARRVTQMERFWLWCRRNPAVAGLGCATAFTLVLGTVVSITFAIAAKKAVSDTHIAIEERDGAILASEHVIKFLLAESTFNKRRPESIMKEYEAFAMTRNLDKEIVNRYIRFVTDESGATGVKIGGPGWVRVRDTTE